MKKKPFYLKKIISHIVNKVRINSKNNNNNNNNINLALTVPVVAGLVSEFLQMCVFLLCPHVDFLCGYTSLVSLPLLVKTLFILLSHIYDLISP